MQRIKFAPARIALCLLFACAVQSATAQSATGNNEVVPGSELTVYLMTIGPGPAVWERFGHNAIWIHDTARATDIAYNYGMFSFEQENFILRFLRGRMDYWMEAFDANLLADFYIQANRSVWVQELNLSPAQRLELQEFLEWNAQPENRVYRYDYYRDNCSTRVRDAIDGVLGGQIFAQTGEVATGTTYREHTRRLTGNDLAIYSGLMLGLGPAVDRPISVWEETFIPMQLRESVREVNVTDSSGRSAPLVLSEREVFLSSDDGIEAVASQRTALYFGVGLVFAALILLTAYAAPRATLGRLAFWVLAGGWPLLAGLLGVVLAGLWGLTEHTAAHRNENLFFINPLLLPLVVFLPAAARGTLRTRRIATATAAVVVLVAMIGLAIQLVPGFPQVNAEIIALSVPLNLALLLAALYLLGAGGPGNDSPPAAD